MRTEGKVSKVAICENCKCFVLACHVDFIRKETEKEFTEFSNEGFDSYADFTSWFNEDFTGKIIHWTDLRY